MLLKLLYDNCDGNGDKKCVRDFNFSAADCLQVFSTGGDSGGREGVRRKDSKVGKRPLPVQRCVGESWFYLYFLKFFILNIRYSK
jgi:hypothetical protein